MELILINIFPKNNFQHYKVAGAGVRFISMAIYERCPYALKPAFISSFQFI